jgi:hypothetical protein
MMDKHEELLREWEQLERHRGNCFIRDGVIDLAQWHLAKRKVLFLFREAYQSDPASGGYDLCRLIREVWKGPKGNMWWTVTNWAYMAQHGSPTCIPGFSDLPARKKRKEALLATAVVNVKKSKGKKSSNLLDILEYAKKDRDLIRQQVAVIEPDMVICGGISEAFDVLWGSDAKPLYDRRVYRVGDQFFVDFWHHPASQFPKRLKYYALAALLQNGGCLGA